jgi:hypothetical protein
MEPEQSDYELRGVHMSAGQSPVRVTKLLFRVCVTTINGHVGPIFRQVSALVISESQGLNVTLQAL